MLLYHTPAQAGDDDTLQMDTIPEFAQQSFPFMFKYFTLKTLEYFERTLSHQKTQLFATNHLKHNTLICLVTARLGWYSPNIIA